jgi:hypothetical protein
MPDNSTAVRIFKLDGSNGNEIESNEIADINTRNTNEWLLLSPDESVMFIGAKLNSNGDGVL